jgi:molybdopterin synthase catalytic subunit
LSLAQIIPIPFEPEALLTTFASKHSEAGGVASFIGYVREGAGAVTQLVLEHYDGFTLGVLDELEASAKTRFNLIETLVVHRVGDLNVGEAIVMVIAVAQHRKPAIQAIDYMMDALKTDAPFWKKEIGPQGATWIEPRAQDYAARQNWDTDL